MNRQATTILVSVGSSLAAAAPARANVLNVPGDAPTIQIAINIAFDGDEIVVAPGTYFESLNLLGKALTLRSSDGPEVTTIDAFGQFDSAIHAVSGEDAVIEGFTITGGNADGVDDGDLAPDERGGGLFADGSSVAVIDCVFEGNVALSFGGAFYSNAGGSASFTGCEFLFNQADTGGVAYVNHGQLTFTDCTFVGNEALNGVGGALRTQTTTMIDDCSFQENSASDDGGGIWSSSASVPGTLALTVVRSNFVGNSAGDIGGGLLIANDGMADLRDTILNGNSAANTGSGIYALSGSSLTLVNATVAHSAGGNALFGAGSKTIRSSIVWNNGGGTIGGGANDVSWSLVEGGFGGEGNIDADPLFVDAAGADATPGTADDDLRLLPGSPAIDAGDSSVVIGEYPVDLDGNPRAVDDPDTADTGVAFLGLSVDMGAYEFQPASIDPSCPADFDGSGAVGTSDLLELLAAWGPCP